MIIDAHTHLGQFNNKTIAEKELLASMDEAGIEYSILIASLFLGMHTEAAIEVGKRNKRIKVIGCIDHGNFSQQQIDSLLGHLKNKDIVGVKFYPGYEDYYPYMKEFEPIYEYCQANNHPIIFHTGVLLTGSQGLLKQAHPLNIDELAHKYPALKIIIAHMGNPWLDDCTAVMWQNPNVFCDISAFFTEYVPIQQDEIDYFVRRLTDFKTLMGNFNKCLFGTDWPLYTQLDYLNAVKQLPMTADEKELVYWKNARDIFNLDI